MRQMRRMCLCFRPKSTHLFHGWNHDCNPSSSSTFSPLRLRSLHRVRHREEQGRIGKDQQRLWMMPSRNGGWVTLGHSLEGPFSLLLLPALPLLLSLILYLLLRYAHLPLHQPARCIRTTCDVSTDVAVLEQLQLQIFLGAYPRV
jgi:hypothetical protein